MRRDRSAEAASDLVSVLAVGAPLGGRAGTLADGRDDVTVEAVAVEDLPERLDGPADCLLVAGEDPEILERVLSVAAGGSVPSVVCVRSREAAERALELGATDVYEDDGSDPGAVLRARIRGAVARGAGVGDADSVAGDPPSADAGEGPEDGDADVSSGPPIDAVTLGRVLDRLDRPHFAVDSSLRVRRYNDAARDLLDLDPETVAGSHLFDVLPGLTETDGDPREEVAAAVREGRTVSVDGYAASLDRWLELTAVPDGDGASVRLTEATERRERERRARTYETVVETVPDGALVVDDDGVLVAANARLAAMTGHDRSELIGSPLSRILDGFPPGNDERSLFPEGGATVDLEVECRPVDGDPFPCELRLGRSLGGATDGTVGILRDLSERDRRERRLRRLVAATRDLMAVDSVREVTEVASDAATEVLDFPGTAFRRYDPDLDALVSVALGSTVEDIADRPTYDVADSPHGRAFRTGEIVVETPDDEDDPYGREVFSQTMYVPVGEYGVLSVGLTDGRFDATDRQLAELLAASTEAAIEHAQRQERLLQYEGVVEAASGMVFALDEDRRLTVVSKHLADRVGYDREQLVGSHVSTLLADRSDLPGRIPGDGTETTVETAVETASGESIPVELTLTSLVGPDGEHQGTVGTLRDITELAEARERLADERDRFTYLFENLPDAVAEVEYEGEAGTIRSVNTNFRETFGEDGDALVGRPLDEFVLPPSLREEGKRLNERAAAGETIETEVRRQAEDGIRHFLLRVVPYESSGGTVRSFTIYTDITEQRRRERYLRVMNRVLRHNLRNDLNVVRGYAEILAKELDADPHREYAARIERTVDRIALQSEAARTVQDAIGGGKLVRETVDLASVVRAAVGDYADRYPEATIRTDLPTELPVEAGPNLDLIVDNLVENAVVHAGSAPDVTVVGTDEGDSVRFAVYDDGPGIPDSERAIITEDREITQLEHGSGLGLWVVKWLVESYGGRIEFVDSDLGGAGVEVRFRPGEDD